MSQRSSALLLPTSLPPPPPPTATDPGATPIKSTSPVARRCCPLSPSSSSSSSSSHPPSHPPSLPHPLHLCLLPSTNNRVHSAIIDLHRCDRSSTPPTSSSSRVAGPLPPHPSPAGARWHWPQQRRDSHPIEHPGGQKLA